MESKYKADLDAVRRETNASKFVRRGPPESIWLPWWIYALVFIAAAVVRALVGRAW